MTNAATEITRADVANFMERFAYSEQGETRALLVYKHDAPGVVSPFWPFEGRDDVVILLGAGYVDDYEIGAERFSLRVRSRGVRQWVTLPFAAVLAMKARSLESAPIAEPAGDRNEPQPSRGGLRPVR